MKRFCECGCGEEILNMMNSFIKGHHLRNRPDIILKRKKTCLENFGVENPMQSKEVVEKGKQTILKIYGVESTNQLDEIKRKKKTTLLKNYKVENPSQSSEIKEKKKRTCLRNYGVENPLQCKKVREKSIQTCLKRFSVQNYACTREFKLLSSQLMLEFLNGQGFLPRKGKNEIVIINELQKHIDHKIKTDIVVAGYYPDGYIEELNMVIEVDESWHRYTQQHDEIKNINYQKNGLKIFRISEKEWLENQNHIISQFEKVVNL